MAVFTKRLGNLVLSIVLFASFPFAHVFGQVVETGHESARGSVDFTVLANYLLAHPEPLVIRELENDEDNDTRPAHPPTPPSLIRYRPVSSFMPPPLTPISLLPVSAPPTDTFESTLDNGTL